MYNTYQEPKTFQFVSVSVVLHVILFAGAFYVATQIDELRPKDSEPVILEFTPTLGTQIIEAAAPTVPEIIDEKPQIIEKEIAPTKPMKAQPVAKAKSSATTQRVAHKPQAVAKTKSLAPKAVPLADPNVDQEISDLENQVNNISEAVPFAAADLNDAEVDKAIHKSNENLQQAQEEETAQAKKDIDQDLTALNEDLDKEVGAANTAAEEEAKKLAAWEAARKETLAKEKSNLESLNNKSHARMAAPQAGPAKAGTGTSAEQMGIPTGVRALEDLKQMPGNPHPRYDLEDRLAKRQGKVSFLAYISKDGYPTQFKLISSTGYRELDGKTLKALKKWRFYPGQEGWVEMPFNWDLKGDAKEFPSGLRRR